MFREMTFLTRNNSFFFIDLPMKFVISEQYDQPISSFLLYKPLMSCITLFHFFPRQNHASQETRRLTACSCFNKVKAARNANPSTQNSTPALPVAPLQSFIHDAEKVLPFRAVSTGSPSLSPLWISPSLDPPLPLQCCKTYTLLVSSPSPPLRTQI